MKGTGYNTEMAIRADQRILLAGFPDISSDSVPLLVQSLTPNGLPDTSFGQNGFAVFTPADIDFGIVRKMQVLSNGKIMIGALIYVGPNDDEKFLLLRLNENGTPDESFRGAGYIIYTYAEGDLPCVSFTVDSLENTFIIGLFDQFQSIGKLKPNGQQDLQYGEQGMVLVPTYADSSWTERGDEIELLPDGKFITSATVLAGNSFRGFVTSRLNPDGSPDPGFGQAGSYFFQSEQANGLFCSIHVQPDGKILYQDYYSYNRDVTLFRLEASGMPDLSFGEAGSIYLSQLYAPMSKNCVLVCPDGTILMPYSIDIEKTRHNYLCRFHPDFTPDTTFGDHGRFELPTEISGLAPTAILFQEGNKVLVNIIGQEPPIYFSSLVRMNVDKMTGVQEPGISVSYTS
ncbi:MAG TPA: hypothetical protein VJ508_02495, partial [Saprospiraceae bacterium]|nr:hypothetical protein [Saprospiraceae bacterium]